MASSSADPTDPSPAATPAWLPDAVFGFIDGEAQARDLAKRLNVPYETVEVHYFPDTECKVRIKGRARRPIVYRPLNHPNAKLIELVLSASVLREDGAKDIALVAPYLPYMRQDIAFRPGEAVSQKIIGKMLAGYFDRFVAVDPHLHRTPRLNDVFLGKPALTLSGAPAMAAHLKARQVPPDVLIMGPDEESTPLVKATAEAAELPWAVCVKERKGDRDVKISLPQGLSFHRRSVVIIDDVISTGATIANLARAVREAGAKSVDVYATHALFEDRVWEELTRASIRKIVSCDGVPHRTNDMSIVDLIVTGILACR
jgi:ribose-phosphate pyrophosphokinase